MHPNRRIVAVGLWTILLLSSLSPRGRADEEPLKGRVPNHYGKLDLTDEQKQRIYKVQQRHDPEIAKLEKQLALLKAREMAELEQVLTAPQRAQLEKLRKDPAKSKTKTTKKKV